MKAKKWICTLLAVTLILGCIGVTPVQADGYERTNEEKGPPQSVNLEESASVEMDQETDLVQLYRESGLFRYIDEETFCQSGHISRLTTEETLNTYVFQNRDGTRSVYYMEENVKYIAPDGRVRDKDTTLVSEADGYTMRDNDVGLLLPVQAADGIAVSYYGNNLRLIPLDGNGEATLRENSVVYEEFYGRRTMLRYTPTLSGVKEDIVLVSYTGMNSFRFRLQTGGLGLFETEGQYYLAENEDREAVFYLGQIIVYDAVGCPSMGSMTVETVTEGQEYILTVSADEDFLTAPTTVYPVTIDPTITITESSTGGVIEDAPVFSGYPNTNCGNYVFNTIGYTDANYGIGRTVVRLNGLLQNETFLALEALYVNKVEFYMRDGGSNYTTVNIHALTGNSTWTENTVTWNNVGTYSTASSASATMGGSAWTAFDITNLALEWKNGTKNGQCGFIMIGAQESTKKIGALSCEYGSGDYWPYVVINYSLSPTLNYYTHDILEGESFTLIAYDENGTAMENATWNSSNIGVATVSATGQVTGIHAGKTTITVTDSQGYSTTCTVYVRIPDGMYYIKNAASGLCMEAGGDTVWTNQQKTDMTSRIAQLWKIEYSTNGFYKIYCMQDTTVAMGGNTTKNVILENAATVASWGIVGNAFGYAIRYGGSENDNAKPVVSGMPGSQVYLGDWDSQLACHWELEKAYGIFLRDTETKKLVNAAEEIEFELGQERTLSDLGICYEYYGNLIGGMTWSSSDASVATVNYAGTVETLGHGQTTIRLRARLNNVEYSASYLVRIYNKAIIIIPGIMGSELVLGENAMGFSEGTILWSDSLGTHMNGGVLDQASVGAKLHMLSCDSTGNSCYDVEAQNNLYGVSNKYMALYNALTAEFATVYTIEFFAYDWRLSNAHSADLLNNFIIEKDYERVVLVCHSMGGLVASGYLALGEEQRTRVEKLITLGSPLLGSPELPFLWGSDDDQMVKSLANISLSGAPAELINSLSAVDLLIGNYGSVYELIPTKQYFSSLYSQRYYLITTGNAYGNSATSMIELYNSTQEIIGELLTGYNPSLATSAEAFHDSLYINGVHVTAMVDTYYIAGYSNETTTMVYYSYLPSETSDSWTHTTDENMGDVLVPVWSATLGDYYTDRSYFVKDVLHGNLASDADVVNFVIDLINGSTSTDPYVNISEGVENDD